MIQKQRENKKDIKVSPELHTKLLSLGKKGETFEDILWRLLNKDS